MEKHEVLKSPGEALLFLVGLALFGISFLVFLVWGIGFGASNRALIPVIAFGQIGILIHVAIEERIDRRLHPGQPWWRRALRWDHKLRKKLWRLTTLRAAAAMVSEDPPGAVRAVAHFRILSLRSVLIGALLIGVSAVVSFAAFDAS